MSKEIEIDAKINPWVAGNLLLGGPIGLVADAASGAAWRISPDEIDAKLRPLHQQRMASQQPASNLQQVNYATGR